MTPRVEGEVPNSAPPPSAPAQQEGAPPQPTGVAGVTASALEVFAALTLIVILILAIGQVTMRYVFNAPSAWTEEVARLLLVWMTFVAAGAATAKGQLLAVDVVVGRLPWRARAATELLIHLLMAVIGLFLVVYGWRLVLFTAGDTSTSLGYSRSLFYWPVVAGGFFIAAFSLSHMLRSIRILLTVRSQSAP